MTADREDDDMITTTHEGETLLSFRVTEQQVMILTGVAVGVLLGLLWALFLTGGHAHG